jgi:hypothetical protein
MTYLEENDPNEMLEHEQQARLDRTARSFILWKALELNNQTLQDVALERYLSNKANWISVLPEARLKIANKILSEAIIEMTVGEFTQSIVSYDFS